MQKISIPNLKTKIVILKGGGNVKSTICSPCLPVKEETKENTLQPHIDQTTTQQQRENFIENVEKQVDSLKSSSSQLKNQNSKVAFTQSLNWLNSNQLVVFDIMLGLSSSDINIIEIFENCISKMLDSVENILKKSKNIYLGHIIATQTSVLATSIYRYYLSHPMDSKKSERITDLKAKISSKLEGINYILDKLKENDISANYFEQSLKIIESFALALPDQQSFKPLMNFASGLGKMIISGGTSGLSDMFQGIKEGLSQAANKKIHEEQIDNFIMYVNLERIKYSIIKILFDKKIDSLYKDNQIKQILQSIGKNVQNSPSWGSKYSFVQILGELILYQPQIDSQSLFQQLQDQKFPYNVDEFQIWDLLVKNNWVTQFKLEDQDKIGFLNLSRQNLDEIDLEQFDQNSNKKLKHINKKKQSDLKNNIVQSLDSILKSLEPISVGLREYMLKGDQSFNGFMSYCTIGLEDESHGAETTGEIFSGKDPLEIIEISIDKILNFSIDFFNQQFANIAKNSENQLRIVFVNSIKDHIEDIANYIFTSNLKFESILETNLSLKTFSTLYTNLDESLKQFIKKLKDYSSQLFVPLQQIQTTLEGLVGGQQSIISVQRFQQAQSQQFFEQIKNEMQLSLKRASEQFLWINQYCQLDSADSIKEFITKGTEFLQQNDEILIKFEKLKIYGLIIKQDIQLKLIPDSLIQQRILFLKISSLDEKDPKILSYQQLALNIFQNNKSSEEQQQFYEYINKTISSFQNQEQINQNIVSDLDSIQDAIFFYIKLINEDIKYSISQYQTISNNLEKMDEDISSFTHSQQWIKQINESLKQVLQSQKDTLTRESLKLNLIQLADQIELQEIREESDSPFLISCNSLFNLFNTSAKLTTEIFQEIRFLEKKLSQEFPEQQNQLMSDIMTLMGNPLNELKTFMSGEMNQMKERLVDDIKDVFKEFQNNQFAKSIGGAISQLKSVNSFINLGGLFSAIQEQFTDQNWRIRERIVLILFDLNRIFGGEEGDQQFANALIHMKAKDTSLKVQKILKNEELLLEMKSILSTNWKSQEAEIKTYIQNHFKDLDEQVKKMNQDSASKNQMLKMYEKNEAKLNQQMENISDIGQMAGIQLEFLKDLKKQLFKLSQDVEEIKKSLENIDDKLALMKGKSVYQLLLDRRNMIMNKENEQSYLDVNINLKVCEYQNNEKLSKKSLNIISEQIEEQIDNPLYDTPIKDMADFKDYFNPSDDEEDNQNLLNVQKSEGQMNSSQNECLLTSSAVDDEDHSIQNENIMQDFFKPIKSQDKQLSIEIEFPNTISTKYDETNMQQTEQINIDSNYIVNIVKPEEGEQIQEREENVQKEEEEQKNEKIEEEEQKIEQEEKYEKLEKKEKIDEKKDKKRKKHNILDTFLDPSSKKNSLLIHGYTGSGKTRTSEQIELYMWQQRRITREFILQKLKQPNSDQLLEIVSNFTINKIYQDLLRFNLIDDQGYFSKLFYEIESELEDLKQLAALKQDTVPDAKVESSSESDHDTKEDHPQEEKEESVSEDEPPKKYQLKDLGSEKAQLYFKKNVINKLQESDDYCYAIYDILDDKFQNYPFPIMIQLDKINNPKNLLQETLSSASQYSFDDKNIRELTQLAKQGEINLVFIIDGYNLLKQEFFGLNLFNSNSFEELRPGTDHKFLYPKVITTCSTNVLSGDYAFNFQNIFSRKSRSKYYPENFYSEYIIEDLNQKQISDFLKQRFIMNLKGLLYEVWDQQFDQEGWDSWVPQDHEIKNFFDNKFFNSILQQIESLKIYQELFIPFSFKEILFKKWQENMTTKNCYLIPFKPEQKKQYQIKLNNINTQKLYEVIIEYVQIRHLLRNVKLVNTFSSAIDSFLENIGSQKKLKSRIISVLKQEQILENNKNIKIQDVINLLTKPINFLDNHFHVCLDEQSTYKKVFKMLNMNSYLQKNFSLTEDLTLLIIFALYYFQTNRFKFYSILFDNYINKQINELKTKGLLIGNEISMKNDCFVFIVRLANTFCKEGIETINYQNQSQLYQMKSIWDEFFSDTQQSIRKQVRECLPLVCTGTMYSFLDPSIQNFIVAYEYYKTVNNLSLTTEFLEILFLFKENQDQHKQEEESETKNKSKKIFSKARQTLNIVTQKLITDQNFEFIRQKDQIKNDMDQDKLLEIVIRQTQETIKKEIQETKESLKSEIHETLKFQIDQIHKSLGTDSKGQDDKNQLYFEAICNNSQTFQNFAKFYKKFDVNMVQSKLLEQMQIYAKQIRSIFELQLNQTPELFRYKNQGICFFILDKLKLQLIQNEKNKIQNNLKILIQLGRIDKKMSKVVSNAIGLLIYSNYSFNRMTFSHLDLSNNNLYGGKFVKCQFNNCNMMKADLSSTFFYKCKFNHTDLTHAIVRNASIVKCKFNQSNLKHFNFQRHLEIDYNKLCYFKNQSINKNQRDSLVHVMVDPFDKNYLLTFHTHFAFIINIKNKMSKAQIIKKFDKPISLCGMIEFEQQNQFCLIAGQLNQIILINIQKMQIIQAINLEKIDQIQSIHLNKLNKQILIGGINKKSKQKYIEIGNFEDQVCKVLIEDCDLVDIDDEKKIIFCHSDDETKFTTTLVCFRQDDYQMIGQVQKFAKKLSLMQDPNLQKILKIKRKQAFDHPSYTNIHLRMDYRNDLILDVQVFMQKQHISTKKNIEVDQIPVFMRDQKKYGKPQQLILNPKLPKQILLASEFGLIQRFNFENERFQNYEMVKDSHQVIQEIQFLINLENKDRDLLSCYIKNNFNGDIYLKRFQFLMQNNQFKYFKILEEYKLKTNEKIISQIDQITKTEIVGIYRHQRLLKEFILIIMENQKLIKKFILTNEFSQIDKNNYVTIMFSDLNEEERPFSNLSIHPDVHEILFFSYDQVQELQNPKVVIFNSEKQEQLAIIEFEFSEKYFWKININIEDGLINGNFHKMFLYNSVGQVKVYQNIDYKFEISIQKSKKNQLKSPVNQYQNLTRSKTTREFSITKLDLIEQVKEYIFYDQIKQQSILEILGLQPFNKQTFMTYDFINNSFINYDILKQEVTIQVVDPMQKFLNRGITDLSKQSKTKKIPTCLKINYFSQLKDKIDNHFKQSKSSLQQAINEGKHQEIKQMFKDQLQLIFHPVHPFIFFVFKEFKVIVVYSLEKKQIIQLIKIPLYYDRQIPFNMVAYQKNKDILICGYYQTIDIYLYQKNEQKKIEEFTPIYTKQFGRAILSFENTQFKNCQLNQETMNILKTNGANIIGEKLID